MIRLNHVSKIYGDGSKKAVDDLSWHRPRERLKSMEKIFRRIRSKPSASSVLCQTTRMRFFASGELNI